MNMLDLAPDLNALLAGFIKTTTIAGKLMTYYVGWLTLNKVFSRERDYGSRNFRGEIEVHIRN